MNTTKKGDWLENQIFNLLKEEISQDRFFIKKDNCRIYQKRGYYSKDREKDIIFDIAVEVFLPGQSTHSLLIFIECKNYSHPVPADDVEEFFQKIQQISGANVKGIIATNNSFQESAFKFSKSKGLGLLRYYDPSELNWILPRSTSSLVSSSYATNEWIIAHSGLTMPTFKSSYFDCYCYTDGQYTNSLNLFLSMLTKAGAEIEFNKKLSTVENVSDPNVRLVEYKDEVAIERISEAVTSVMGYKSGEVPIDRICNMLTAEKGLRIIIEHTDKTSIPLVLGKITFDPFEITIYSDNDEDSDRQKYTMAHELGHYYLGHSKYMSGELCQEENIDLDHPLEIGIKDIIRMEWQANYFASCLLLPKSTFVPDFLLLAAELPYRGYGVLYLDNQPCNQKHYYAITNELKNKYKVSRSVVKIRLKKLGLLKESFNIDRLHVK